MTNEQFNQEQVESKYGLPGPSACALSAYAWLMNEFLGNEVGKGRLNAAPLLESLRNAQNKGFDKEGSVLSYAEIGKVIAQSVGSEMYLSYYKDYNSLEELEKDNIKYYLTRYVYKNNPDRVHFTGTARGVTYDSYTTHLEGNWWQDKDKIGQKSYRAFK